MFNQYLDIRVTRFLNLDSVGFVFVWRGMDKKMALQPNNTMDQMPDMEWKEISEARPMEPTFNVSHEVAQQMMDQLWQMGMRPAEAEHTVGHVEALGKHLEDMRLIAFKGMKMEKP